MLIDALKFIAKLALFLPPIIHLVIWVLLHEGKEERAERKSDMKNTLSQPASTRGVTKGENNGSK